MTTKKDNFSERVNKLGEGNENTLGVAQDGMQDPTGEFPKRDYNFGTGINKAARGIKINELYVGGGDIGVSLGIQSQRPSEYPFNQVSESLSGHIVEYDDTPGGERVLIKHRTGAGVEMRADGSVLISAVNNKVEVTGGDQTVIVEGHGNLIYNGNLNLKVTGDYNIDVGGNMNLNVAGNLVEQIEHNHKTTVTGNTNLTTKGTKTVKTVGTNTEMMLSDNNQFVKGNQQNLVEGNIDQSSEKKIFVSGKESYAVSSKNTNITGAKFVSVLGQKGAIGGKKVDFTGNVYQGNEGATAESSGAIFHGTFKGIADEAIRSYNANVAGFAEVSDTTNAQSYAEAATSGTAVGDTHTAATKTQATITGEDPLTPLVVVGHATSGSYAIKNVVVDAEDSLKNKILLTDDYKNVFDKIPTTQEIRSALRNSGSRDTVGSILVSEERLNPDFKTKTPPSIGRTAKKSPSSRFGFEPIGNALENRGKRFTP
jgi:hypothetical protein